jgi:tetratricopeptide (TPR) repeat protein
MNRRPNRNRLWSAAGSWTLVGALLLSSSSAWALDKNQILNLQAAGLSPDVIVNVIRSSTEPLTVTEADINDLRVAGVAQPVLDELCSRIGCASAPGPGTGTGVGGGPGLQQEIERQRQLEEQRRRIEMERMEREREAMRQRIEQENQRRGQVQQAFAGLRTAERLQRDGDNVRAAAVYQRFLTEVNPAKDSAEYVSALTGFVRAMHAAGFRYVIRSQALEWVLLGPEQADFEEGFSILTDISREAAYDDPQFERLADFNVGERSREFQDRWNFFLGRFFWTYDDARRAVEFLGQVSEGSPDGAKAAYLAGTIHLKQQDNAEAIRAFQTAVVRADRLEDGADVRELGYLALARLAYEVGQNDAALFYYRKIPAKSPRHPRAVFEQTWAYFLKQDWPRVLGSLHALHSPYYDRQFFPELFVIEAAAYLNTCNLDQAEQALAQFTQKNSEIQSAVTGFVAETTSPDVYWDSIESWYDRQGTSEAVKLPVEAVRYVLADQQYQGHRTLIDALRRESTELGKASALLGAFATDNAQALDLNMRSKLVDGGLRVAELLRNLDAELTDWNVKSQEVGIEVNTELLNATRGQLEGRRATLAGQTGDIGLAQDWLAWPYEGEYWADEVDYFRGNPQDFRDENTGLCANAQ